MNLIKNKEELKSITILTIFCIIMFFVFLGSYPLIDVDETRYVRIAQEMFESSNFLTPVINGEIFLEKPPLFFWLESLSFLFFGVNEWSARLPMALMASFGVFMMYFFGKKTVSSRFGLLSALSLGASVIFIVLSHIAILDLLLSVTMMVSAYFGIMTLFSQGKENWLYWGGFYLFTSLSALSKGLPGIVIPFAIVFFAYLFSKRVKELFDFKKIGVGVLLMLVIILPWHFLMCKVHGQAFIDEYIIKHHLARFLNSQGINRKEPWWFYIPVIFVGCIPFIFVHLTTLINEIRKIFVNFKNGFNFNIFKYFSPDFSMEKRFLSINIMAFLVIFLFFSSASTKLPTYVLRAAFPLAFISGYIFNEYIENNKFATQIKISNIIISSIFLIVAITGCLGLIAALLKVNLGFEITKDLKILLLCAVFLFGSFSIFNFIGVRRNYSQKYFFGSCVVLMLILTLITNLFVFNFVVNFGQRDLINYAKYAKENNLKLATFDFGHRYSIIYYYGDTVDIQEQSDYKWLEDKLNKGYVVVLKNKKLILMNTDIPMEIIEKGVKYTLVQKPQKAME
ncbi:glycosyltransferase family 39 protein [bacterium]|nr:glycosyltransferase family 39 protein [bacterium]